MHRDLGPWGSELLVSRMQTSKIHQLTCLEGAYWFSLLLSMRKPVLLQLVGMLQYHYRGSYHVSL